MNEVIVINNPSKPPSVYEYRTRANAALDSRPDNIVEKIIRFADVTIDVGRRRITRSGEGVNVTPAEYNLLLLFIQNVDRPLTRDAILNVAWGYDCLGSSGTFVRLIAYPHSPGS